jgi:hypothetical protein
MMSDSHSVTRRGFIGGTVAALAAAQAAIGTDSSKAAAAGPQSPAPGDADKAMPYGLLGKKKLSRLFFGGNLVTGCMHCRGLKYVEPLFRAYVNEAKLFETFKVAEEHGINVVFESGQDMVQRYNKEFGGHMFCIPSIHPDVNQSDAVIKDEIKQKVDGGAPAVYVWGVRADGLVHDRRLDIIAKAVDFAKAQNVPAGVGAHCLTVIKECEKAKIPADFYVKTFHSDDYPTATPKEKRTEWSEGGGTYDNMWCNSAEETAAFMHTVAKPWIAFKILAAGAIAPRQGFAHAFRGGADFIAVGMFDFQVKENCELMPRIVKMAQKRTRPWYS